MPILSYDVLVFISANSHVVLMLMCLIGLRNNNLLIINFSIASFNALEFSASYLELRDDRFGPVVDRVTSPINIYCYRKVFKYILVCSHYNVFCFSVSAHAAFLLYINIPVSDFTELFVFLSQSPPLSLCVYLHRIWLDSST